MGKLARRMLVTLLALLALDLAAVATVAYLLTPWLAPVRTALAELLPFGGVSATVAWWAGVLVPALAVFVWAQLRYTRARTLREVDAREVTAAEYPDLHERVRRLAQQADVQPPTIAVAPTDVPNSFVVGTLGGATLLVSEGLLDRLDGAELDAVLAHELAHVANHDATVMTLASFLPALSSGEYDLLGDLLPSGGTRVLLGGVGLVTAYLLSARFIEAPLGSLAFTAAFLFVFVATLLLGGVLLGVFTAPVVLLGRSLSRYREFAADRAGARMTGNPAALVSALETLADGDRTPETDKRAAYAGVQGLCFLAHGFGEAVDADPFETRSHPPVEERIGRLGDVTADL